MLSDRGVKFSYVRFGYSNIRFDIQIYANLGKFMQIICKLLIMYANMQKCGFGPF